MAESKHRSHRRHRSHRSHRRHGRRHRSGRRSSRRIRRAIRKALAKQGGGDGSAGSHPKVASPAQMGGSGFDAVPDSNTLLSYKLLRDSFGDGQAGIFKEMLNNEMKYLLSGITLLENDPWISTRMGGTNMRNATVLAQMIKNKQSELDWDDRITPIAHDILYHQYGKPGKSSMAPNRIRNSALRTDNNGTKLLFYNSNVDNYGVELNNTAASRAYAANNVAAGGFNLARPGGFNPYLAAR